MRRKVTLTLISLLIAILHILPFYILITTAFKAENDLSSKWEMPGYLDLGNFASAWKQAHLALAFRNNIIVTFFAIILIVAVGSIAAYPLARRQTRFNHFIYVMFVSALIVPPLTILVPLYRFMVNIGGMNHYWGDILLNVTFSLPMTIFLYTGFINTIPRELDEAGMIDGASRIGLFYRIIMPLLKPITATVVIFTGIGVWNDYQFSVFFMQKINMHTITVALASFVNQYDSDIGWVAAGSLLGALPMIVIYLFLQRYFISGLASGAVKG